MKMSSTYQQQKRINVDKEVPNLKQSNLKLQREYNSAATTYDKVYHVEPDYGSSRKKACGVDKVFPLKPVHHKRAYSLIKIPLANNNNTKMLEPLETTRFPPISPLLPPDCPRMSKEKVSNRLSGQRFPLDQVTLPPIHCSLAKASMWAKGGTGEARQWESERGTKEWEGQNQSWLTKDIHRIEVDLQEKLQKTQETLKRIWKERAISAEKRQEDEKEKVKRLMERDGSDYKKAAKYDRQESDRREAEMERKGRECRESKMRAKLKEGQLERQRRVMEAELKNERIVMEKEWERERNKVEEHESEQVESRERIGRVTQREEKERRERGKKIEWEMETAHDRGNENSKMVRDFQKDRMGREGEIGYERTQKKSSQARRQEVLQGRDDSQCHSPWKAAEDSPMSPVHLAEENLKLKKVTPSNINYNVEEAKLLPCSLCHRNILPGRLESHERVCKKKQESKPKLFDSFKQRAKGTALEEFVKHNGGSNKIAAIKKSPRQEKQKIVRKLQEGHLLCNSSLQPQPPPTPLQTM